VSSIQLPQDQEIPIEGIPLVSEIEGTGDGGAESEGAPGPTESEAGASDEREEAPETSNARSCQAGAAVHQPSADNMFLWCWAACASMVRKWALGDDVSQGEVANIVLNETECTTSSEIALFLCNQTVGDGDVSTLYKDWNLTAPLTNDKLTAKDLEDAVCPGTHIIQLGLSRVKGGTGHFILVDSVDMGGDEPWFRYLDPDAVDPGVASYESLAQFGCGTYEWKRTFTIDMPAGEI
jgi:hypothetical protein